VKIDHMRNCLLCHPPAINGKESVLGVDPIQSVPRHLVNQNSRRTLTTTFSNTTSVPVQALVASLRTLGGETGCHDYKHRLLTSITSTTKNTQITSRQTTKVTTLSIPMLIRADITFLRQDFSVGFPVGSPVQQLPPLQAIAQNNPVLDRAIRTPLRPVRFDFVVRIRPVHGGEWKKWRSLKEESNPQRDAVLFALRELTGQDHGTTSDAWVRAFPLAQTQVRSLRLTARLLRMEALARGQVLQQYRDSTGLEYSWALARAIPRLSGSEQEVARLTLVNRLAKAPAAQLRQYLSDRDAELRHAAVQACAQTKDRSLAADLVALLEADAETARLAREALKRLTDQDLPDAASWRKCLTGLAPAEQ
jgi:hypothetical protein